MKKNITNWMLSYSDLDNHLKRSKLPFLNHEVLFSENRLVSAMKSKPDFFHHRSEIKEWFFYQNGDRELTQELFYTSFLKDLEANQIVYFMCDETDHILKSALKFDIQEFYDFSNSFEDHLSMEFFQFSYYVLIFPKISMIRYLDEEGGVNQYKMLD